MKWLVSDVGQFMCCSTNGHWLGMIQCSETKSCG